MCVCVGLPQWFRYYILNISWHPSISQNTTDDPYFHGLVCSAAGSCGHVICASGWKRSRWASRRTLPPLCRWQQPSLLLALEWRRCFSIRTVVEEKNDWPERLLSVLENIWCPHAISLPEITQRVCRWGCACALHQPQTADSNHPIETLTVESSCSCTSHRCECC